MRLRRYYAVHPRAYRRSVLKMGILVPAVRAGGVGREGGEGADRRAAVAPACRGAELCAKVNGQNFVMRQSGCQQLIWGGAGGSR
eukprot:317098-Rhodomonas_salina.1